MKSRKVRNSPTAPTINNKEATRVITFCGRFVRMILRRRIRMNWRVNRRRKVFQSERRSLYSLCTVAMPILPIQEIFEMR